MLDYIILVLLFLNLFLMLNERKTQVGIESALQNLRRDLLKTNVMERTGRENFDEAAYWREEEAQAKREQQDEPQKMKSSRKDKQTLNQKDEQVIRDILAEYLG